MLSHKTLDLLTNTTSLQPSTVATSSSSCSSSTWFFFPFCKLAAMFVFYILKISQPLSTGDDPSMGFKGGFFFLIDKFLAFSSCLSELTGSVFVVFCTLPPPPKRIGGGGEGIYFVWHSCQPPLFKVRASAFLGSSLCSFVFFPQHTVARSHVSAAIVLQHMFVRAPCHVCSTECILYACVRSRDSSWPHKRARAQTRISFYFKTQLMNNCVVHRMDQPIYKETYSFTSVSSLKWVTPHPTPTPTPLVTPIRLKGNQSGLTGKLF